MSSAMSARFRGVEVSACAELVALLQDWWVYCVHAATVERLHPNVCNLPYFKQPPSRSSFCSDLIGLVFDCPCIFT